MEKTFNRIVLLATIIGMIVLTALLITQKSYGSAPSGLPGTVASSTSQTMVARTARVLIATSTCSARVITSRSSPLMLTFSDYNNASPTGTFGHLQAASTTVVYDSGQFGCGLVKGWADTADTITVTDVAN